MDDFFIDNINWNIDQISVQTSHAESVKGRARSGYYKAAIILAASVVEALAYRLLEVNQGKEMPFEDSDCYESITLPASLLPDQAGYNLMICKRTKKRFKLESRTDFSKVINISFKLSLFSHKFKLKLDKIRELRNKVHIQGLKDTDRSYTKKELESVSYAINKLIELL